MREFVQIMIAALGSSIAGGLFGSLIGWLSPEFIDQLTRPQPILQPVRFAAATGLVAGLFIGAATMGFGLLVAALRAWIGARSRAGNERGPADVGAFEALSSSRRLDD